MESPGQEEMYVVVSGAVDFDIDGERVEAAAGTVVFLPLPHVRRGGVATEDETVVLAVGGWPDKPYHSLPWEPIYLVAESMRKGDWAAAAETLEREAGEHRDTAILQFRLAFCHARLGEDELALEELRRAIEMNPGMRERAANDDALAPLLDRLGPVRNRLFAGGSPAASLTAMAVATQSRPESPTPHRRTSAGCSDRPATCWSPR